MNIPVSKTYTETAPEDTHEIIQRLRKEPNLLSQLTPRKFEELVADILQHMGYEVQVTSATRDAGVDIILMHHDPIGTSVYAVECKYYSSGRPVGIAPVRALYGAKELNNANRDILVTNTRFSEDAKEFASKFNEIQLVDGDQLLDWIKQAENTVHP